MLKKNFVFKIFDKHKIYMYCFNFFFFTWQKWFLDQTEVDGMGSYDWLAPEI